MASGSQQGARTRRTPSKRPLFSNGVDFSLNDDVEDFVEKRHSQLASEQGLGSDGEASFDEPEVLERDVLPIEVSDSEDDEGLNNGEDDGDGDDEDDDDKRDWGAQRRQWYGGDTYEYEIMEEKEREAALQEEEEEAMRMQRKAMSELRGEDFGEDGEEKDSDKDRETSSESEDTEDVESETVPEEVELSHDKNIASVAPEVHLLAREAEHCESQMKLWKPCAASNDTAAILFHLYASFVSNVAFYLSLRTDPDATRVDLKTHPVIARIVRVRTLLKQALSLPDAKDANWDKASSLFIKQPSRNTFDGTKGMPYSNGFANGGHSSGESDSDDEDNGLGVDGVRANKDSPLAVSKKGVTLPEIDAAVQDANLNKKKRKKKLEKSYDLSVDSFVNEVDDDKVNALLGDSSYNAEKNAAQEHKRRKLNYLTNEMERERKNKEERRMMSAEVDNFPGERKVRPYIPRNETASGNDEEPDIAGNASTIEDDNDVKKRMVDKKARRDARKARKVAEASTPHVYTFDDRIDSEEKRKATTNVVKNRGLTRYRPRDKKTPRTKNRLAYKNALKRRKSVAREYTGKPGLSYAGEATGINMSVRRGSKLSTV